MITDLYDDATIFFGSFPTDLYIASLLFFGTLAAVGGIIYYLWTWGDK